MQIPNILMGRENPNGWKLESILEKLRLEVEAKSDLIADSDHPQRDLIINNNAKIQQLLLEAQTVQEATYTALDERAPNKGPLNPRL